MHADRDGSTPDDAVEPSFEQILARLHQVVERLESGELPLEESLTAFEEGVRLSRLGASRLDAAERRVEELLGDSGATRPLPDNAALAARAADSQKTAPPARDRSNRDE